MATYLAGLSVVKADDHGRVGYENGIVAALGRDFETASDRSYFLRAVRQFLRHRLGVDGLRIRHRDGDIDEHVVGGLAQHPEKPEAGMTDRIRHRPLRRFRRIPAMD